jgi:hypothetical protein
MSPNTRFRPPVRPFLVKPTVSLDVIALVASSCGYYRGYIEHEDEHIVLYHQVLNHVQLKCNLQVVVVVHTQRNRYAVLFSTDVDLEPQRLYRYYKARFQIEFLFRDAKQFAGLSDCQARSKAKLDFHFNASLSAVTFAKLEARHQTGNCDQAFSMASLKRRAFNTCSIEFVST